MSDDGVLYGLRVRSQIPLPHLLPWQGPPDHAPDLKIARGAVPTRLPDLVRQTPFQQVSADGRARFAIDDVIAVLVEAGQRITVSSPLPDDAPDLPSCLLGPVLGVVLHQRGLAPLHAACLEINGQAVAFAGPSGKGKSTLAAALLAQGHRLLNDDITVLSVAEGGRFMAIPGYPQQRLWRDALEALSLPQGRPIRSNPNQGKFERGVMENACTAVVPLAAICHLAEANPTLPPGLQRAIGIDAVELVRRNIYRFNLGASLTSRPHLVRAAAGLAASVPQYRLHRPITFADLPGFAAALPTLLWPSGQA